jgi:uncharacterized protein YabE (DUF348 family)
MLRKYAPFLAAALLLLLAAYRLRPLTFEMDGVAYRLPFALTTGQALAQAGVPLSQADQVTPAWDAPLPLNGRVRVVRAVQAVLWEDGQARTIHGTARQTGALLRDAGVALNPQDRLYWNGKPLTADALLPAGKPLVLQLRRARAVIIERQGGRSKIDSAAPTAAAALWEAGLRIGPGDVLSVAPGASLLALQEQGPAFIAYLPAQTITIRAGGASTQARSTAATIGAALAEAGLPLQGLDYTVPAEDTPLPQNGRVRVVRVREDLDYAQELIPYTSERVPDPEGELDQTRLLQAGRYGVKVVRERARFEDNVETMRGFDSDWVAAEPVAESVGVGTQIVTKTLDVPGGTVEYWRAVNVYATSYSPCRLGTGDGRCGYITASGARLTKGIIAVTRAWYRQIGGMRVYVPGYGYGVIGDVGGGIPGRPWIDLGFDEDNFEGIVGWVTMYFLTPAPANPSWSLP